MLTRPILVKAILWLKISISSWSSSYAWWVCLGVFFNFETLKRINFKNTIFLILISPPFHFPLLFWYFLWKCETTYLNFLNTLLTFISWAISVQLLYGFCPSIGTSLWCSTWDSGELVVQKYSDLGCPVKLSTLFNLFHSYRGKQLITETSVVWTW